MEQQTPKTFVMWWTSWKWKSDTRHGTTGTDTRHVISETLQPGSLVTRRKGEAGPDCGGFRLVFLVWRILVSQIGTAKTNEKIK